MKSRLGPIQREIVAYLSRCGNSGGHIGSTSRIPEFQGYFYEGIERSLLSLEKRDIVYREGIRYILREGAR